MLSEQALKEFQNIWKSEYNETLPEKEALEKATELLLLIKAIYKPIPKNKSNNI